MPRSLAEIEAETGVTLGDAAHASVQTVNALEPATVEALRSLPRVDQHVALRHLLTDEAHPAIDAFMDAVERGANPRTWGRGGVLVPAPGVRSLMAASVEDLLAKLRAAGEGWVVVDPDASAWRGGDPTPGAPGIRLGTDVDIGWTAPDGTTRVLEAKVSDAGDPRVAARRWMASRLAAVADEGERAAATLRRATPNPSEDAAAAARALDRERDELGPATDVMPGFRGPDDWYEA
jgi:hypothetical protein